MTRLEDDLKACCNFLDSNKITERKKYINNLKDLLQRRDVIQLLNDNSENSSHDITWENLFTASHRGLLKDADKIKEDNRRASSRQQSQASNVDIAKPSCALITLIASKANAGGVHRIPCKLLVRCVLNILEDQFNRKYFGATYIQILQHRVLSSPKYCTEISSESWKELLKQGIDLYKNLPPAVDKATAASLLELIIQKGCEQSFLARHVKKRFSFFVEAVKNDANSSFAVEKNLLQLALTVCQQLGKESRMAICMFGEKILSDIIDRYEYRAEEFSKKKAVVLDFLVLQVKAHHPGGAKQGSMAAYAHQWDTWKNQLKQMYRLLYGEIMFIVKQDNNKVYHLKENFLTLAVDVCKQVFEGDYDSSSALDMSMISVFNDTAAGPAPKRIRLETGIPAILSQLKSVKKPIDMWPWLAVLTSLISTYPELVSEADLESLLQFVADQQQACKNSVIMEYLCRCCVSLLKVEEQLDMKLLNTPKLTSLWETIYNTTLRAIGLNLSEEHTHCLIQTLISSNKKFPIKPLINVFMTASINLSEHSLKTLNILSQKTALFDDVEIKGCQSLQDWILPNKEDLVVEQWGQQPVCFDVMARVLLALTFKSAAPSSNTPIESFKYYTETSVEQTYSLTVFESGLLVESSEEMPVTKEQQESEVVYMDETLIHYLVSLFARDTHLILDKTGQDTKLAFSYLIPHCHVLVEIITCMQKWDLPNRNSLIEYLNRSANKLSLIIKDVLGRERDCSILSEVLEKIGNLFEHAGVNDHKANLCVLTHFYNEYILPTCLKLTRGKPSAATSQEEDVFNFGDEEEQNSVQPSGTLSPLSKEIITGWSAVQMAALKALVKYSCAPAHSGSSYNVHTGLIVQLFRSLTTESSQVPSPVNLQMSLYLVQSVLSSESLNEDILQKLLVFVQGICRKWHPYSEVTYEILGLLEELVKTVHQFMNVESGTGCGDNLVALINGFTKYVREGKYGARVCERFVKCVGRCAVVDQTVKWSKWDKGTSYKDEINASEYLPIAHEILPYISSPFHQVRMTAASFVSKIFKLDPQEQQMYETYQQGRAFRAMMSFINEAFIVEVDLTPDEQQQQDEGVLRSASCLHCIAAVIATSSKWRRRGLTQLFHLAFNKKLNPDLVRKVLNLIGHHLKIPDVNTFLEGNLRYLVWDWHETYGTLNDFPWKLFGAASESDFFSHYSSNVVPILIHRKSVNCLKLLSIIVNLPLPALIKTCYPQVMAPILAGLGSSNLQHETKEVYNIVQNIIGEESIKELLSTKLPDVLLAIMELLYDPELMGIVCGSSAKLSFPEPEQINFKTDSITGAIKYLQETSPNPDTPLMTFLSKEMPSYVEKILLQLCSDIHTAVTPEYRLLCLQRYITFCDILILSIVSQSHKMSRYIIHFVIQSLLHLVNGDLKFPILCYLKNFIVRLLPDFANTVNSILHILVPALVAEANIESETGNTARYILRELIIKHHRVLPAVACLDPLPSEPVFAHLSAKYDEVRYSATSHSLESEIKHFLEAGKEVVNPSNRIFGLKHLRKQLSEKKSELASLYMDLEARNSSTDSSSIVHQLICMLIELACIEDSDVKVLSACCLGELGVGNLTTFLLKAEKCVQDSPKLLGQAVVLLRHFLTDADISVVKAASVSLYAVFSSNPKHSIIETMNEADVEFLHPFLYPVKKSKKGSLKITVNEESLKTVLGYFCPVGAVTHDQWITRLVCGLLQCSSLEYLQPVCKSKVLFSEEIMPYIVDLILRCGSDECVSSIVQEINEFFSKHINVIENSSVFQIKLDATKEIYSNRASVQCMLNTVNMIRLQQQHYRTTVNLNYLHVAKAAQFCMAYFTSVFYAELWCNNKTSEADKLPGTSRLEYLCQHDAENGSVLQSVLFEAYTKIGEPDAVYGCGNSNYLDYNNRIKRYQYEGKWNRVIEALDMQLSSNLTQDTEGLLNALHRYGLHYTAGHCRSTDRIEEAQYEYGWRLGQWNLPEPVDDCLNSDCHQSLVYAALRALHRTDKERALKMVDKARHQVLKSLVHSSLEASNSVYSVMSKLQALQEIEDFAENNLNRVIDKWKEQDKVGWNHFKYVEPVIAQRLSMLKNIANMGQDLRDVSVGIFLSASETARQEGFYVEADRWLNCLNTVPELLSVSLCTKQLQEAQLLWDRGESPNARYLLSSLISQLEDKSLPALYSTALRMYGSWMADSKSESAQQIVDEYLMPAWVVANHASEECVLKAAGSLAYYADFEYENLLKYMQSPIYTSKIEAIEDSMNCASVLQEQCKTSQSLDLKRSLSVHNKLYTINRNEVENTARELGKYLILAARYYTASLALGDCNNLRIFRVVSLWLNNSTDAELQTELDKSLDRIPSYKFLPVLPQLIARISDSVDDPFTKSLHNLIERCAVDHPHHTLPLVLALFNSYKDSKVPVERCEPRVLGAQLLVKKLQKVEKLGTLISDMQKVAEAYISLANSPRPDNNKKGTVYKIPEKEPITKLKDFPNVLCPTVTLPISKAGRYDNIIGIHRFEDTMHYVGGINLPKKVECVGTDGVKRLQLVKGNDDLRQDAVMQQVFTIMNTLLQENKETRSAKLQIRTYKVVPLSQRSGVLEWCTNTIPLSTYLVGTHGVPGAHEKYRPNDYPPSVCRVKLDDVAKRKATSAEKLRIFKEICVNFKPVFHHFFLEKFRTPGLWFERRLAYTHSVATSSMIGYILGLGDRHVLNILIDQSTAEVIHIDFGIAFEQGLLLPTPETVPFRLTRDIEDGMGISGTEGVFRRTCEKTMQVLRECQETILTILEVLLYDPLYAWTMTPAIAQSKQPGTLRPIRSSSTDSPPVEKNKLAERALLKLRQKLQGIEEGVATSVEGQVSRLVHEATNPNNLCCLFHGWQAYV